MKKLFTLLLCLGFISFASAQAPEAQAPAAPTQGPAIKFTSMVHDYGQINRGADGSCVFEFENVGTEPLVLSNVQSSCGCTVPAWSREEVAPGAKGSITVRYDTNRVGGISKSITVYSNDATGSERLVLRITGNVAAQ